MGKNTEAKLRKIIGEQKLKNIKENKPQKKKPAKPKLEKSKVVTEDSQANKTKVTLIFVFVVLAGFGIYLKFFTGKKKVKNVPSSTEFFGTPPPRDDNMLDPMKLTKEQIQKYTWLDNPIVLANRFEIISFFRSTEPKVRIKIKTPEFRGKEIPLRGIGDMLTDEFRIIDIQDPVVFLSDKDGKMHRLVDPKNWNIAAAVFSWKKNLFGDPNEVKLDNSGGMTPEEAKITFGDYELVGASNEQISALRAWVNANPDYRYDDFASKCSQLKIVFKQKLETSMGGMLKPMNSGE